MQTTSTAPGPRERILETASVLFYEGGLRAVGIDTIIATAEVAKASFYKHFASKDDLVLAFLERRDVAWREWLRTTVEQLSPRKPGRPLAVFDALEERFARSDYRGCAFINSMVELADDSHAAHVASAKHKAQVMEYLKELLTDAGYTRTDQLAYDLMLLIDGAIVARVRDGVPDSAAAAKRIATLLLNSTRRSRVSTRTART